MRGEPTSRTIVQIITRLIVGGAQLSVIRLCEALGAEGFDVRIIVGPEEGSEGSLRRAAAAVAPVTVLPRLRRELAPAHDAVALFQLRRLLALHNPGIVHTHSSKAGIVGRLAAQRSTSAVVHTVHGWGHTPNDLGMRRATLVNLERAVAHRTDAIVAVSDDVRDEGLQLGIGRESQYRVIPEFVDYEPHDADFVRARAKARRSLGLAPDDEVIGWVGRFVAQKDPETLVSVIAELLDRRASARVVLVGDGPQRAMVAERMRSHGLADRVLFAGLRPDARELYAAFDVLVHPSLWEGQPRVVQEALAERIPVIAARVTGTAGLIREGRTGFLPRARDVAGFVEAAGAVLDCPGMRPPLPAAEIRGLAALHGGAMAARERHLSLYEELLAGRRS